MGIAGHILGPKKLRQLNQRLGTEFDRAYRYVSDGEGRIKTDKGCRHFRFDYYTKEVHEISDPIHWSTCKDREQI